MADLNRWVVMRRSGVAGPARPWRLMQPQAAGSQDPPRSGPVGEAELSAVARGREDESYRRWLEHRGAVPQTWHHDEAFSQVV